MVYFNEVADIHYKPRRIAYDRETDMPVHRDDKMEIAVFETREYTAEGAWAHTVPSAPQKFICILPPELRDYRLPIHKHEALHNVHEGGP